METKPFHESIVDALKRVKSKEELKVLEKLIIATKVPKDHEEILRTFRLKAKKFEMSDKALTRKFEEE